VKKLRGTIFFTKSLFCSPLIREKHFPGRDGSNICSSCSYFTAAKVSEFELCP
jgi:hypothetical protein